MPGRSYDTLFALFLLDGRIGNRRAFTIVNGIKGASGAALDKRFFESIFEAEDEADFEHSMHVDRVKFHTQSARRQRKVADALGEAALGD